jgi:hypothetical protein
MSVIVRLLSKFDDSGIKKAQKGFGGLKSTLGAIGIGFGIKQIADGLLEAAKAASADEKSTRLLNTQLARNAGATKAQLKQNDQFIESLSLQTGIMDDDLRPAMAKFGNVTKNVKDAQKLLKITIDGTAGSGKSQTKIANAVAKAYAGNTKALQGMFPELAKSKDVLGDFAKTYEGMAEANADPFMKFNNSMDILKEKLGVIVLPLIIDAIDQISQPGGLIEVVGQFFDDLANPKSDAGKTFQDIKDAVGETIQGVKDFFALFGGGDAMEGFKNVATTLVKALPALLALKAIMVLANSGKAIANLITAMTAIAAGNAGSPISKFTKSPIIAGAKVLVPVAITAGALESIDEGFSKPANREALANQAKSKFSAYNPGMDKGLFVSKDGKDSSGNVVNNVTINVQGADPKAVVNAWVKYSKQNGGVPNYLKPKG